MSGELTVAESERDDRGFIAWWELPEIPDVLQGNGLLNAEKPARVAEHYAIWRGLIHGLAAFADQLTLCLRYRTLPDRQQIRVFVGCRIELDGAAAAGRVPSVDEVIATTFERIGAKPRRLDPAENRDSQAWSLAASPHDPQDGIAHICQWFGRHEWQIARSRLDNDKQKWRWSLRPFGEPAGTVADIAKVLFDAGMQSTGPNGAANKSSFCCFSVYLRPTHLTVAELQWLWNQAIVLGRHAYVGQRGEDDSAGSVFDRSMEVESNNIQHFASQLEPAFTVMGEVLVRGSDSDANRQQAIRLAKAIAATISRNQRIPETAAYPELLSGKCLVAEPQEAVSRNEYGDYSERVRNDHDTEESRAYAFDSFDNLRIRHWISWAFGMGERERRIPYLCNASGAGVLMRLPVDVGNGLPGIPVRQAPPDFDPGHARVVQAEGNECAFEEPPLRETQPDDVIVLGELHSGGPIRIRAADLTRHTLVVGNTGSGKTITTMHLLRQLKVPFLVLETAKKEYRGLMASSGFSDAIQVFTPGSEGVVPLRINPFELLPGVRVEYHVGALQTCFEAALPLQGPLFAILEEALVAVYRKLGWRMDEARPPLNLRSKPFPTMNLFAMMLRDIADKRGYADEFKNNITAAISGRISPMTIASGTSKGKLLDCYVSYPSLPELFTRPTVLELNDLRTEEKALVTMILLVFLREYREMEPQRQNAAGGLRHLAVIEEAHNVLATPKAQSGEDAPDTRNAAIERFSNMLTEMRSLGQGILIADQSPHKILPDALRNTNLQIVHQLRAEDDREAVASSMVMSTEQVNYVAKMRPGQAAVFYTGLERATFVQIPEPLLTEDERRQSRALADDRELRRLMQHRQPGNGLLWDHPRRWPHRGCLYCPVKPTCPAKDFGHRVAIDLCRDGKDAFQVLVAEPGKENWDRRYSAWVKLVEQQRMSSGIAPVPGLFWCALTHVFASSLEQHDSNHPLRHKLELASVILWDGYMDFKKRLEKAKEKSHE